MNCEANTESKPKRGQFTALAILCLAAGLLLTLDNIGVLPGVWKLWPIFPFLLGIGGIYFFRRGGKDLIPLGIGVYLVLISTFFLVLNYTTWSAMKTLWPAFIGLFGFSLLVVAFFAKTKKWYAASGLLSIFLATVFFMVFTIDVSLWPVSLMLFGIWLLIIPGRSSQC